MALALRNPFRRARAAQTTGPADESGATTRSPADEQAGARRPTTRQPATAAANGPGTAQLAAARGAWAVGSLMIVISRIVRLIVAVIVLLIVAAILLRVLSANPANSIVKDIHDAGRALVGPFKDVFSIKEPKVSIAVNWGVAAIVYLIIGGFIASLIARIAPRPQLVRRRTGRPVAA
jgi:hypothetical protein